MELFYQGLLLGIGPELHAHKNGAYTENAHHAPLLSLGYVHGALLVFYVSKGEKKALHGPCVCSAGTLYRPQLLSTPPPGLSALVPLLLGYNRYQHGKFQGHTRGHLLPISAIAATYRSSALLWVGAIYTLGAAVSTDVAVLCACTSQAFVNVSTGWGASLAHRSISP